MRASPGLDASETSSSCTWEQIPHLPNRRWPAAARNPAVSDRQSWRGSPHRAAPGCHRQVRTRAPGLFLVTHGQAKDAGVLWISVEEPVVPVLEGDEQLLQKLLQSLGPGEHHLPHRHAGAAKQSALSAGLPRPQQRGLGEPRVTQSLPLGWDALGSRRGPRWRSPWV